MTLFYPDVSNNNWGGSTQTALSFCSQLKPEGFHAVVHKVSEGSYYADPFWQPVQQWAKQNSLLCLGYHYVTEDDPSAQAQTWLSNNGGVNAMFDWEANSGDLGNFWNVVNGFNDVGVNVAVAYCPQWYWDEVGGGDFSEFKSNGIALVSSAYPDGSGYASVVYDNCGGDNGEGWNPYGHGHPAAWQFTDAANIAGFSVDCNAFKSTAERMQQIFAPQVAVSATKRAQVARASAKKPPPRRGL